MKHAQQTRSRNTTVRILNAAAALLRERSLDEISVNEIAQRAGVSVGGFYARFASKEDVVGHLCDEAFLAAFRHEIEDALVPEKWQNARIEDILTTFHTGAVQVFRQNRPLLREVVLLNRTTADEAFRERIIRFDRDIHRVLRTVLLAHAGEIRHADPSVAIDLGIVMVSALMREVILFTDRRLDLQKLSDEAFAEELTRIFCGYLGVSMKASDTTGHAPKKLSRARAKPVSTYACSKR